MSELKDNPVLTPDQVRERTIQSPQMPMMYFNYVRIANSFYDFRLFFGNGSITARGEQTFTEEVCVTLSPEMAKLLRDSLTQQLQSYDEKFGHIRDLDDVKQREGKTAKPSKTSKPS